MPRDIENMPFARTAPFQEGAPADTPTDTPARDASLRLENILLEEFNYASVTAYQAQEDRARMFNLYLLLIGVLGSGLAAVYQLGGGLKSYAGELSITLLVVAGFMGVAFFTKLIRLRQAWRESALAMSVIKEYYIREFTASAPKSVNAFYWRLKSLPTGEKRTSTTAVVCGTVAALGALCFGGAAVVAGLLAFPRWFAAREATELAWAGAGIVTVGALLLFLWGYSHAFDRVREATQTLRAASNAGLDVGAIWKALRLKPAERERTRNRLREGEDGEALVAALDVSSSVHNA
ncbi:MAG TPA: hypothetical protein VE338_15855 [Ktedonobacterales bacterium]|jgi:hypothetical protein|nr:hypothetical protein [Ktedonobacterales bacterium]